MPAPATKMSQQPLRFAAMAIAALVLTGCGHGALPTAPRGLTASTQVGLPGSYVPGAPVPGADGTPSLRTPNFPKFTHDAQGLQGDPVNVLVAASEAKLRQLFRQTGWLEADKRNLITSTRTVVDSLLDKPYATAPMSDLYLYNRVQDIAMQKNGTTARNRDHLRAWKTPLLSHAGTPFWAVAATKDIAIKWAADSALPTHEIAPDVDSERALVVGDFAKTGQIKLQYALQALPPDFKGVNAGGDGFYTDGRVMVLELK